MGTFLSTPSAISVVVLACCVPPTSAENSQEDRRLEEIVRGLKDKNPGVRMRALGGQLRPLARQVTPYVIELLEDPDFRVRARAAGTLANLANALPDLGARFKKCVPKLVARLHDQHEDDLHRQVRRNSTFALGKIGSVARPAVPIILTAAADPNEKPELRRTSVQALGEIGHGSPQAVHTLTQLLDDPSPTISLGAFGALARLGRQAAAAQPPLLNLLDDRDPKRRAAAAYALGTVGLGAPEVEMALLERLNDDDQSVQRAALRSLEGINETYAFFFRHRVSSRKVTEKRQALFEEISRSPERKARFIRLLMGRLRLHTDSDPKQVRALKKLRELQARECLPIVKEQFEQMEKKVTKLESGAPRIQLLHTMAAFLPDNEVVPFLIKVDSDPGENPKVRVRAAILLCARADPDGIAHIVKTHARDAERRQKPFLTAEALKKAFKTPGLFASDAALKSLRPLPAEEWRRIERGIQLVQHFFNRRKGDRFEGLALRKIQVQDGRPTTLELWLDSRYEGWEIEMRKAQGHWVPCVFRLAVIQ